MINDAWFAQLQALYSMPADFSQQRLQDFYHADACFVDPIHRVQGTQAMQAYFSHSYQNLLDCQFTFTRHNRCNDDIYIVWDMHFRHPRLQRGAVIHVPGMSHLQLRAEKIHYHRDYYDAGAMLYENVPVLGTATRWLKRKLTP